MSDVSSSDASETLALSVTSSAVAARMLRRLALSIWKCVMPACAWALLLSRPVQSSAGAQLDVEQFVLDQRVLMGSSAAILNNNGKQIVGKS